MSSLRCSFCKTENAPGALLCSKCGRSLSTDTPSASAPAPVVGHSQIEVAPVAPTIQPSSSVADPGASLDVRRFAEGEIYQPSGRAEAGGLPMMILGAIVSGLAVGAIYHFVSRFIDLIFIFPLIAGFGAGLLVTFAVSKYKVRSPKMAGTLGALAGLLVVLTMQVVGAYSLRSEMVNAFTSELTQVASTDQNGKPRQLTPAQLQKVQDTARNQAESYLTPWRTLALYESFRGEAGSSLGRGGSGGIELKGAWFWLLEIGEALAIIVVAWAVASGAASKPFCESCDTWHEDKQVLKVHPSQNPILWEKVEARDWSGLLQTPIGEAMTDKMQTTVSVTRCPKCDCGTLSVTSAGGTVPEGITGRQLAPDSTRTLLAGPPADAANVA